MDWETFFDHGGFTQSQTNEVNNIEDPLTGVGSLDDFDATMLDAPMEPDNSNESASHGLIIESSKDQGESSELAITSQTVKNLIPKDSGPLYLRHWGMFTEFADLFVLKNRKLKLPKKMVSPPKQQVTI